MKQPNKMKKNFGTRGKKLGPRYHYFRTIQYNKKYSFGIDMFTKW